MLKNWKKNKKYRQITYTKARKHTLAFLLPFSSISFALPDIPSLMDCQDIVFNSGFQNDSEPSNGSGGSYPGSFTRSVFSEGLNRNYYVSIPPNYNPSVATPLLFTWHGSGGAGNAPSYAISHRDFWKPTGDTNNFIVVAQAGTSVNGGWYPARDFPILTAILDDMNANYNVEKTRIYGRGFSAGAHVLYGLMLSNANDFAGFSIGAGALESYAGVNAPSNASKTIPVYISHGNNDNVVPTAFAYSNYDVFLQAGWQANKNIWLDIFSGVHEIEAEVRSKSWDKLCTFTKSQISI